MTTICRNILTTYIVKTEPRNTQDTSGKYLGEALKSVIHQSLIRNELQLWPVLEIYDGGKKKASEWSHAIK